MPDCNNPCQRIICEIPDDLRLYSLDGLPPESKSNIPKPPARFLNQQVAVENLCPNGSPVFSGQPPSWIQVDIANNRAIGRAGSFGGPTQALADAIALQQLTNFIQSQSVAGNLTCDGTPTNVNDLVWSNPTTQPCSTISGSGPNVNGNCVGGPGCGDIFGGFDIILNSAIRNPGNADITINALFNKMSSVFGAQHLTVEVTVDGFTQYNLWTVTFGVEVFTPQVITLTPGDHTLSVGFHAFGTFAVPTIVGQVHFS